MFFNNNRIYSLLLEKKCIIRGFIIPFTHIRYRWVSERNNKVVLEVLYERLVSIIRVTFTIIRILLLLEKKSIIIQNEILEIHYTVLLGK